jgi:hypothetical protein
MKIALEVCSIETEAQVGPGLDQIGRGAEEGGGECHRVTYGATHPDVKLSNEGDVHQGRP